MKDWIKYFITEFKYLNYYTKAVIVCIVVILVVMAFFLRKN